eukprot:g1263.t1
MQRVLLLALLSAQSAALSGEAFEVVVAQNATAAGGGADCSTHTAEINGACITLPRSHGHCSALQHDLFNGSTPRLFTALPATINAPTHCVYGFSCLSWALLAVACGFAAVAQAWGLLRARARLQSKTKQIRLEHAGQVGLLSRAREQMRSEARRNARKAKDAERELSATKAEGREAVEGIKQTALRAQHDAVDRWRKENDAQRHKMEGQYKAQQEKFNEAKQKLRADHEEKLRRAQTKAEAMATEGDEAKSKLAGKVEDNTQRISKLEAAQHLEEVKAMLTAEFEAAKSELDRDEEKARRSHEQELLQLKAAEERKRRDFETREDELKKEVEQARAKMQTEKQRAEELAAKIDRLQAEAASEAKRAQGTLEEERRERKSHEASLEKLRSELKDAKQTFDARVTRHAEKVKELLDEGAKQRAADKQDRRFSWPLRDEEDEECRGKLKYKRQWMPEETADQHPEWDKIQHAFEDGTTIKTELSDSNAQRRLPQTAAFNGSDLMLVQDNWKVQRANMNVGLDDTFSLLARRLVAEEEPGYWKYGHAIVAKRFDDFLDNCLHFFGVSKAPSTRDLIVVVPRWQAQDASAIPLVRGVRDGLAYIRRCKSDLAANVVAVVLGLELAFLVTFLLQAASLVASLGFGRFGGIADWFGANLPG